jgi:hypothetical protein
MPPSRSDGLDKRLLAEAAAGDFARLPAFWQLVSGTGHIERAGLQAVVFDVQTWSIRPEARRAGPLSSTPVLRLPLGPCPSTTPS